MPSVRSMALMIGATFTKFGLAPVNMQTFCFMPAKVQISGQKNKRILDFFEHEYLDYSQRNKNLENLDEK